MLFFWLQNTNEQYLGEMFFDVSLACWSLALVVVTQLGLGSAFVCAMWVAFPLLTKLMVHMEFKQNGKDFFYLFLFVLPVFKSLNLNYSELGQCFSSHLV